MPPTPTPFSEWLPGYISDYKSTKQVYVLHMGDIHSVLLFLIFLTALEMLVMK